MNPSDPQSELEQLRARNRALESESVRLKAESEALRQETLRLEAKLALKEGLEEQLREVLLELAALKRQLFGERSERLTSEERGQLAEIAADLEEQAQREPPVGSEVLEEETEEPAQGKELPEREPRRRRHPQPEHLERQTVVLEPESLAPCEQCGRAPERIGEEVSEELEYVPARVVVRKTVRPKYACRCGGGGVQIARLPARLLPQSKLGVGLAVYLLLARFDDHVAYYTLERVFRERHGVIIPRQQMVQWVSHIAFLLQPLWRLMFTRMKQGAYLQVDETPVKVLDPEVPGKCARGYLWFYAVPDGDVFLDYQGTRGRDAPHAQLTDFSGTIQTDAYEVYDSLKKVLPPLQRIGCAAHARRKFYRALKEGDRRALAFLAQFRKLYALARHAQDLTPENRQQLRQGGEL